MIMFMLLCMWMTLQAVISFRSFGGNQSKIVHFIPAELIEFVLIPIICGEDRRVFACTCSRYRDLIWNHIASQTMMHYQDVIQTLGISLETFMHDFVYTSPSAKVRLGGSRRGTFVSGNYSKVHYITFELRNRTKEQYSTQLLVMQAINGRLFQMRMVTLNGMIMEHAHSTNRTAIFLFLKVAYKRLLFDFKNTSRALTFCRRK